MELVETGFDDAAVRAMTDRAVLGTFGRLRPGAEVALDVDFYAARKAVVWLVRLERDGSCTSSTVHMTQGAAGSWDPGQSNSETWSGWIELATKRPDTAWPGWGLILGQTIEQGHGVPGAAHSLVRGITTRNVVGIEFGPSGHRRRHGVHTETGAFVVAVDRPFFESSPILKAILRDGSVINL